MARRAPALFVPIVAAGLVAASVPAAAGLTTPAAADHVGSARVAEQASPAVAPRRLPVAPTSLALPTRPGRELIDAAAADADADLAAAGSTRDAGPALDPTALQPDATAPAAPAARATSAQLTAAVKIAQLALPVDPATLLRNAGTKPGYRVCSRSALAATSCSQPLPIAVPALVDVTGDGKAADLLVDALPTSSGLGVLAVRVATSELATSAPLRAHVWVVPETSGAVHHSFGFDGVTRGAGLPRAIFGAFTVGAADVRTSAAAASVAITTGTSDGPDSSAVSVRVAPVPARFSTHAQPGSLDANVGSSTDLDAIVATRRDGTERFTRLAVAGLVKSVSATLVRPAAGAATVDYSASSPATSATFADYAFAGGELRRAVRAVATTVPERWTTGLTSSRTAVTLRHSASAAMTGLATAFYDAGTDTSAPVVARMSADTAPLRLSALAERAGHVRITADRPTGTVAVALAADAGEIAPLTGDHLTFVRSGDGFGLSAAFDGLRSAEAWFDRHPRLDTTGTPSGRAFTAAADVDGAARTRIDVAALPATLSADLNLADRSVTYRAAGGVRIRSAYVDTRTGPSIVSAVDGLSGTVVATYPADGMGSTGVRYTASTMLPRAEFFYSPDGVESGDPDAGSYLSAVVTGIPRAAQVLVDFAGRHLEATAAGTLGGVAVLARDAGLRRAWSAYAVATEIPGRVTADFGDGAFALRAATGAVGSAEVAVSNHGAATVPAATNYLAAHYDSGTGDVDAAAAATSLSTVAVESDAGHAAVTLASAAATFAVDVDTLPAPDARMFVGGTVSAPGSFAIATSGTHVAYTADRVLAIRLTTAAGHSAVLGELFLPLPEHGVVAAQTDGDSVGANIVLPRAPSRVDIA